MKNTNKILLVIGIIALLILIFNWNKIFNKANGTSSNSDTTLERRTMCQRDRQGECFITIGGQRHYVSCNSCRSSQ